MLLTLIGVLFFWIGFSTDLSHGSLTFAQVFLLCTLRFVSGAEVVPVEPRQSVFGEFGDCIQFHLLLWVTIWTVFWCCVGHDAW